MQICFSKGCLILYRDFPVDKLSEWFESVDYNNRMTYLFKQEIIQEAEGTLPEENNIRKRARENMPNSSRYSKAQPLIYKVQYNQRLKQLNLSSICKETELEHQAHSADFKTVTGNLQPILCYTRASNLGEKLIWAKVNLTWGLNYGMYWMFDVFTYNLFMW